MVTGASTTCNIHSSGESTC